MKKKKKKKLIDYSRKVFMRILYVLRGVEFYIRSISSLW